MAYRKIGAKRKKSAPKRKSGRRRRKMSGIGAINIENLGMTVLGVGAGAIAAREANTLQTSAGLNLSPGVFGIVQIAAGVFLMTTKTKFLQDMGMGMIGTGVTVEAVNLGLISGTPTRTYQINGTPNLAVVGKMNRLPRVAGTSNLSVVAGGQQMPRVANASRKFNGVY